MWVKVTTLSFQCTAKTGDTMRSPGHGGFFPFGHGVTTVFEASRDPFGGRGYSIAHETIQLECTVVMGSQPNFGGHNTSAINMQFAFKTRKRNDFTTQLKLVLRYTQMCSIGYQEI